VVHPDNNIVIATATQATDARATAPTRVAGPCLIGPLIGSL
jgi:hypothetical protein